MWGFEKIVEESVYYQLKDKNRNQVQNGGFDCGSHSALIHLLWLSSKANLIKISYFYEDEDTVDLEPDDEDDSLDSIYEQPREGDQLPDVYLKCTIYDKDHKISKMWYINCIKKKNCTEDIPIPENSVAMSISYRSKIRGEPDAIEQQTEESDDVHFLMKPDEINE